MTTSARIASTREPSGKKRRRRYGAGSLLALTAAALIPLSSAAASDPTPTSQWYQVELHGHSVLSGDAVQDEGINAAAMKAAGYDAGFITDHQATSNDVIGSLTANHVSFDDTLVSAGDVEQWDSQPFGASAANTVELVNTPVNTGTKSLHLSSTSAGGYAESFVNRKRGPVLRDGPIILKFSIRPTQIPAGGGAYVSLNFTVEQPKGGPSSACMDAQAVQQNATAKLAKAKAKLKKARGKSAKRKARAKLRKARSRLQSAEVTLATACTAG